MDLTVNADRLEREEGKKYTDLDVRISQGELFVSV